MIYNSFEEKNFESGEFKYSFFYSNEIKSRT